MRNAKMGIYPLTLLLTCFVLVALTSVGMGNCRYPIRIRCVWLNRLGKLPDGFVSQVGIKHGGDIAN